MHPRSFIVAVEGDPHACSQITNLTDNWDEVDNDGSSFQMIISITTLFIKMTLCRIYRPLMVINIVLMGCMRDLLT